MGRCRIFYPGKVYVGEAFSEQVYKRSPEESYERLLDYLHHLFPQLPEQAIKKFLR